MGYRCWRTTDVQYDFCYLAPDRLASYRGYHNHLALGWSEGSWPNVRDLLVILCASVGKSFKGWKGGNYTMDRDTPATRLLYSLLRT